MMDIYQLLLPQSILTFSSNPAIQKREQTAKILEKKSQDHF
jgi:hypothetical protein